VDNTLRLLLAISTLAAAQTKGTKNTSDALIQLLDYAVTQPDAAIRYHRSNMVLYVHRDTSYISEPKARSSVGGYFYKENNNEPLDNPKPNGPIHVESRILCKIMAAASKAEIGAFFHNRQETIHFRLILHKIERRQSQPTSITTYNSMADGFATKTKQSKAIDMPLYLVQDRVEQGQISVRWGSGILNHADYFTKHHPPSHHKKVQSTYLYTGCCVCTDCNCSHN
jgi:hypothetical protein